MAASVSGRASVPSMTSAGSPGRTSTTAKTTTVARASVTSAAARRRERNSSIKAHTSPVLPGESHVRMSKLLFELAKWIQKMVPVEEGAIDEELRDLFCGPAGPSGGQRAARSERSTVRRLAGDAVWGDELHGHGAVCAHQGLSADADSDAQAWAAQP